MTSVMFQSTSLCCYQGSDEGSRGGGVFLPPAVHTQRLHPTQISGANEQMQPELTEAVIYTLHYWYLDKFHI